MHNSFFPVILFARQLALVEEKVLLTIRKTGMKQWKVTLACPLGEKEDNRSIFVTAETEVEALAQIENLPNSQIHCAHGPLKAIELTQSLSYSEA